MIKKMPVWQQLTLFALVLIIPLTFALGRLVAQEQGKVQISQAEIVGARLIQMLLPIQRDLAVHRGTAALWLNGQVSLEGKLRQLEGQLKLHFSTLQKELESTEIDSKVAAKISQVDSSWRLLETQYRELTGAESFSRHSDIIASVIGLYQSVAETSYLSLSSQPSIRYLTEGLVLSLPVVVEASGRLRGGLSPALDTYKREGIYEEGKVRTAMINMVDIERNMASLVHFIDVARADNPELSDKLWPLVEAAETSVSTLLELANQHINNMSLDYNLPENIGPQFFSDATSALSKVIDLWIASAEQMNLLSKQANQEANWDRNLQAVIGLLVLGLTLVLGWLMTKHLTRELGGEPNELRSVAETIAEGTLDIDMRDSVGVYAALKDMKDQIKNQLEKDRAQQVVNTRLKQAIETTSTSLMVADENFDIVYINPANVRVLTNAESEIRKRLPAFSAADLLGKNIDIFHKNPEHQRRILKNLHKPFDANLSLGNAFFDLKAGTIRDSDDDILGFVVEWRDVTEERNAKDDLKKLVQAGQQGDLSHRIAREGKSGFFLELTDGLNDFVSSVDSVVGDISQVMERVANGDTSGRMKEDYQGRFRDLALATNSTMERLGGIVSEMQGASDSVRSSASEIAAGNSQLSERTEKQSSSLEETASSVEQLSSNVRNTADNSRQADQLASLARESAQQGGEVIDRTVSSMKEINQSSQKIAEIISVIDDIAFQTNLLALNASVEAARAGDQGRGFAVVATEVRNLAQRSANSAREIKELIEDSVHKVQNGSELVNESGRTLEDIIGNVKKVSDLISDIAVASEEQSSGLDQVNRAIAEMDDITQQNAALAEETASAAESTLDTVNNMVQVMSFFQVEEHTARILPDNMPSSRNSREAGAPNSSSLSSPSNSRSIDKDNSVSSGSGGQKYGSNDNEDDEWEVF